MVEVFVERISGGIVRVGASRPPQPYDYSVTYDDTGKYAIIKGFSHKHPSRSDFETVIRKINEATGKLVAYDRAGPPPVRKVQIHPAIVQGRILMSVDRSHLSKTHIPSPARAQKRDGSINEGVLQKDGAKAFKLFDSGKEKMLNAERVVLADGSVIDMFHHIAVSGGK